MAVPPIEPLFEPPYNWIEPLYAAAFPLMYEVPPMYIPLLPPLKLAAFPPIIDVPLFPSVKDPIANILPPIVQLPKLAEPFIRTLAVLDTLPLQTIFAANISGKRPFDAGCRELELVAVNVPSVNMAYCIKLAGIEDIMKSAFMIDT